MDESIRDTMLDVMEASLEAQLRAVRRLRKPGSLQGDRPAKAKSHLDMVEDVLTSAGTPLHLKEVIRRVEERFGVKLDSDSIVSALAKCVLKGERFVRPAKNTFAVLGAENVG